MERMREFEDGFPKEEKRALLGDLARYFVVCPTNVELMESESDSMFTQDSGPQLQLDGIVFTASIRDPNSTLHARHLNYAHRRLQHVMSPWEFVACRV